MKLQELHTVGELLRKLTVSKLSIENLKKTIRLQKAVKGQIDGGIETQKTLLEGYGLEPNEEGQYHWGDHEESAEIDEKIKELVESDFHIGNETLNYMEEDEFYGACQKSFELDQIEYLEDFVVIQ